MDMTAFDQEYYCYSQWDEHNKQWFIETEMWDHSERDYDLSVVPKDTCEVWG